MGQVQLATRIDARVKKAVEKICESRGLKMNRFIEEALLDKLEELEDVEDLKTLLCEPTRPLSEILKDLKLDGKSESPSRRGCAAARGGMPQL